MLRTTGLSGLKFTKTLVPKSMKPVMRVHCHSFLTPCLTSNDEILVMKRFKEIMFGEEFHYVSSCFPRVSVLEGLNFLMNFIIMLCTYFVL